MSYLGCRSGLCQSIQLLLAVPDDASILPSRQGRRYCLVIIRVLTNIQYRTCALRVNFTVYGPRYVWLQEEKKPAYSKNKPNTNKLTQAKVLLKSSHIPGYFHKLFSKIFACNKKEGVSRKSYLLFLTGTIVE
jgi:hypothetical protein